MAIDWPRVGIDALGIDAGHLICSPLGWTVLAGPEAETLVQPVFEAYVEGLHAAGWAREEGAVRRTYFTRVAFEAFNTASIVLRMVEGAKWRKLFEKTIDRPHEELLAHYRDCLPFYFACSDFAVAPAGKD